MSDVTQTDAAAPTAQGGEEGTTFTSHELLYLLALNDTEASAITRQHLRLGEPVEEGTRLYAAGAATLSLRGLLRQDGEDLVPSIDVQALTLMLTEGEHWVEVGMLAETAADGAVFVSAGGVAVALMARDLGKFTAAGLESADLVTPLTIQVVRKFLGEHYPGAVSVHATTANEKRQGLIHRTESGAWMFTTGIADDEGNMPWTDLDDGDIDPLIESLTARPPDDGPSVAPSSDGDGNGTDESGADDSGAEDPPSDGSAQ